ncbi:DUF3905 domain-containing protein [Alicyclobacillaceae bacterium I2511]|nr:DUF3905 domain-containing protein [Alicyclobacillaceae bacterium I2511]
MVKNVKPNPKHGDVQQRASAEAVGGDGGTIPPWRETPLDHWSREIDPAIMAGDEWAGNGPEVDPGAQRLKQQQGHTRTGEIFMHPTHDSNYELENDTFVGVPQRSRDE